MWACGYLNLSFTVLPEWGSPYPAMPSALALPLVSGALHLPDLGSEVKVSAQLTSPCSWALEELGWLVSGQWDSVPYLLEWPEVKLSGRGTGQLGGQATSSCMLASAGALSLRTKRSGCWHVGQGKAPGCLSLTLEATGILEHLAWRCCQGPLVPPSLKPSRDRGRL